MSLLKPRPTEIVEKAKEFCEFVEAWIASNFPHAGCVAIGAAVSRLPFLSEPNGNMAVVPYLATWFGCGVVAGFLMPDRPWRWAAAMAIGPPIATRVTPPYEYV